MLKNENTNEQQNGLQSMQLSPEIQQQITALNAHVNSVNFAYGDLIRELENTLKILLGQNAALRRRNAELTAPKKPEEPKQESQSKS